MSFLQREMAARARKEMEEHRAMVAAERDFLKLQRWKAETNEDSFYMEIDGMDQSKTNLPHYPNLPKNVNKDLLMQIHVTAVRYVGNQPPDIYIYPSTFAHDSNCTCTIIYMSVLKVSYPIAFIVYIYSCLIFYPAGEADFNILNVQIYL